MNILAQFGCSGFVSQKLPRRSFLGVNSYTPWFSWPTPNLICNSEQPSGLSSGVLASSNFWSEGTAASRYSVVPTISGLDLQIRNNLVQFGRSSSLSSEWIPPRSDLALWFSVAFSGLDLQIPNSLAPFRIVFFVSRRRPEATESPRSVKAMGGSSEVQGEVIIMRSRSGQSLCYLQMDGVLYPPLPDYTSHLKQLQDFPCRSDDVWIFGYPKSGKEYIRVRCCLGGKKVERYYYDERPHTHTRARTHAD